MSGSAPPEMLMRGGDAGVRQWDTRPLCENRFQTVADPSQDQLRPRHRHAANVWRAFEADLDSARRDSEAKSALRPQRTRRGPSANWIALPNRDQSAVPVGQELQGISEDPDVYRPVGVQEGRQRVASHPLKGIGASDSAGAQRLAARDCKRRAQNDQSTRPPYDHMCLPGALCHSVPADRCPGSQARGAAAARLPCILTDERG